MELNKVIRKQSYVLSNGYQQVSNDFIELFEGFEGVSVEQSHLNDDEGTEQTKIYLDKNKRIYLLIVPDDTVSVRISIHCGDGNVENVNWAYVDQRAKNEKIAYSFAKTPYGVVFSTFPYFADNKVNLSDGYLQNYFTTFETSDGRIVNGFIHCSVSREEVVNGSSYIVTEEHRILESIDVTKCFLGNTANQTVLVNAASYAEPLVCNYLYKKVQTEESKFGRIKLNDRLFISGSHFCLKGEDQ